jgi:hypothetical protein
MEAGCTGTNARGVASVRGNGAYAGAARAAGAATCVAIRVQCSELI